MSAELACYHVYESGGENSTTRRIVQWSDDLIVDTSQVISAESGQTGIPLSAYIPSDCKPTGAHPKRGDIEWELIVRADTPGIDFTANFLVPVFITKESRRDAPAGVSGAPTVNSGVHLDKVKRSYAPTVEIREAGYTLELYAGRLRNMHMNIRRTVVNLFATVFLSVFCSGIFFVPFAMLSVFLEKTSNIDSTFFVLSGEVAIVIVMTILWMWFAKSSLYVRKNEIVYAKKLFGLRLTESTEVSTIIAVKAIIDEGSARSPVYTIVLMNGSTMNGKAWGDSTIEGLSSREEAEDLCCRIREFIGL